MTCYSVKTRGLVFVRGFKDFHLLLKIWVKILVKNIKTSAVCTAINFLIMLNNLAQIYLKLLQKGQLKKQKKRVVILLENSDKILQKYLQRKGKTSNVIKKYKTKKDIYISRKKTTKLLMN